MLNIIKLAVPELHPSNGEKDPPTPTPITNINSADPGLKKKARSERQREASRRNGRNGHGPKDTRRTRCNAWKHGFRSEGLTRFDNIEEFERNVAALKLKYASSDYDPYIRFLIRRIALGMVRCDRAAQLEASTIIALCGDSEDSSPTIHPGLMRDYGETSVGLLQRYENNSENSVIRARRELERIAPDEPTDSSADIDPETGNVTI